jgi:6,7-dimethyl-8-ribityllumazine synthase
MGIAILSTKFHKDQIELMLKAARDEASKLGLEISKEEFVPGSMEQPLALKRLLQQPDIKGVVVLGIIEKGETKHGLVMAQAVNEAIIRLSLEFDKPLGVGILGPEILPNQIPQRLEPYARAAVVALHTMLL